MRHVSLDRLKIDQENAATFLVATYDKNTKDALYANEFAMANNHGVNYLFIYGNLASQFDSPEATKIREHFFDSIKWTTPTNIGIIQQIVAPISENRADSDIRFGADLSINDITGLKEIYEHQKIWNVIVRFTFR